MKRHYAQFDARWLRHFDGNILYFYFILLCKETFNQIQKNIRGGKKEKNAKNQKYIF